MTIEELIKKYKLNNSVLADVIGKRQSSFHEKLHQQRGNSFNNEQKDKLKNYLKGLANEISFIND